MGARLDYQCCPKFYAFMGSYRLALFQMSAANVCVTCNSRSKSARAIFYGDLVKGLLWEKRLYWRAYPYILQCTVILMHYHRRQPQYFLPLHSIHSIAEQCNGDNRRWCITWEMSLLSNTFKNLPACELVNLGLTTPEFKVNVTLHCSAKFQAPPKCGRFPLILWRLVKGFFFCVF